MTKVRPRCLPIRWGDTAAEGVAPPRECPVRSETGRSRGNGNPTLKAARIRSRGLHDPDDIACRVEECTVAFP